MPPAVLATPETPFPKVEVTKPIGLLGLLLFEVGIIPCGRCAVVVVFFCRIGAEVFADEDC